ncbi:MAG: hypothetical protein ACRDCT_10445 [Shewanella sp.]|uniref:hypothetical protein n=1 Tax=Shewanella sp. TaxID=50422 RepID=UPI003F40C9F1
MDDQANKTDKLEKKKGFVSALVSKFRGYSESDATSHNAPYQIGEVGGVPRKLIYQNDAADVVGDTPLSGGTAKDWIDEFQLPVDRGARYSIYQEMAESDLVSAALQMHIAHALAPDMATGNIITIEAKDKEHEKLAAELMADLGKMLNDNITSWAMLMCIYGVHYLRPYGEQGKGVTDIESSYYTLAKHVREYMRGDLLCGFTSDHLITKDKSADVLLSEPWSLVALKVPFWLPDLESEPEYLGGEKYSLFTDLHRRTPIETQNYGTSFLQNAYVAWVELKESTRALRGARYNASRQDRFIGIGMEGLDPVSAAKYLNTVSTQMRKDMEAEARVAVKNGMKPTIWNRLLPVLSGGKGGLTIDSQQTSPDINGIEDTLFNLKRFCAAMGIDPAMMGWSDMMAGGLGEGGWSRTSIIAALRANWVRIGVRQMVERLIDIHIAYKHGKAFPTNESPFNIKFHSINTALAIEKQDERQGLVDFTTAVATLLDMVEQGSLSGSETFKRVVMSNVGLTDEEVNAIIDEIAKAKESGGEEGEDMYESADNRLKRLIHDELNNVFLN